MEHDGYEKNIEYQDDYEAYCQEQDNIWTHPMNHITHSPEQIHQMETAVGELTAEQTELSQEDIDTL